MRDFFEVLHRAVERKDSLLCVGLDPQRGIDHKDAYRQLIAFGGHIVEQTERYAVCFKPNIAFFEAHGAEGIEALEAILHLIPEDAAVILDAKRGDIGNTAAAYAEAAFGSLGVDAVTLSPYLGRESVGPFLDWKGKGLFVLCRTSNPGSGALQELEVAAGGPYYLRVAREAASWSPRVGLVVAGNLPGALSEVRRALPAVWMLAPGIGAQGGTLEEALGAGLRADGAGILVHVSRGIAGAASPADAARRMREQISRARDELTGRPTRRGRTRSSGGGRETGDRAAVRSETGDRAAVRSETGDRAGGEPETTDLVRGLLETGCFKLGRFTLKSGLISPFYIDLRMIISDPSLLERVARAYQRLLEPLSYDRIAGIPLAGAPIATAVSLRTGDPMLLPRLERKEHGTGRRIEGAFSPGERAVLLDDLITAGTSKIEAASVLREEGLVVEDLVVLVERGSRGRDELRDAGIRLHAALSIDRLLQVSRELGSISPAQLEEIRSFLAST